MQPMDFSAIVLIPPSMFPGEMTQLARLPMISFVRCSALSIISPIRLGHLFIFGPAGQDMSGTDHLGVFTEDHAALFPTTQSDTAPRATLAVTPDMASEPPHSMATRSLSQGREALR